ncbi:lipopolysaccharide transport periplasmic protein LptA [Ectothiorhodospiraceae bacterium BW-2]|nr:lipopolysaccharide transport periplasmic protein LptA [Ectothiorhodospiraceae bacterium BW-2]
MIRHLPHMLLLLALTPLPLTAAERTTLFNTSNEPISIQSDTLTIDESSGISLYQGQVVLQQGDLTLKADRLEIVTTDRAIASVTTHGTPTHLQQLTPTPLEAQANTIRYDATQATLDFQGNARLTHSGDQFSGNAIRYLIHQNRVEASSGGSSKQRVHVILQPREAE